MLRKLLLSLAGIALTVLGIVGLVVPIIPGVLLLAGAAACFSMVSMRVRGHLRRRLDSHPHYRHALRRWHRGRALAPWPRIKLGFWLAVGSMAARLDRPTPRNRPASPRR